jgi:hypothetical protein
LVRLPPATCRVQPVLLGPAAAHYPALAIPVPLGPVPLTSR